MFPLSPLPFCRVLRSRWDLHAKPLRRFDAVGGYINVTDSHDAVISGFNSTAYRLAVYASCRRCRRLRNTRFRVVANLSRVVIADDRTHPVDFLAFLRLPRLRAFHGAMMPDPYSLAPTEWAKLLRGDVRAKGFRRLRRRAGPTGAGSCVPAVHGATSIFTGIST